MAGERKQILITQVKSAIGEPRRVKETLRALGIKHHQQTVEQADSPAIRGMIASIHHLVTIEEA